MRASNVRAYALAAALAAGPLLGAGAPASAQNAAVDRLIDQLRPRETLSDDLRGAGRAPSAGDPAPAGPRTAGGAQAPRGPRNEAPSVSLTVQFANNSAELTPAATRTLDDLGHALSSQALSRYRFRIEGHTDAVGTYDHNMRLSGQRAASVVEYLVAKFNLDRLRLEVVGLGPSRPAISTPANVPQPLNRRVRVVNLGG